MKTKFSFLLWLTFVSSCFSAFSQTVIKKNDSIFIERPVDYVSIDQYLRKYKNDTTLITKALPVFIEQKYNFGTIYLLLHLGNNYRKYSMFDKAVETHKRALDLAQSIDDKPFITFSLNMIGVDYRRQGAHMTAIDYNKKSLEIAEAVPNPNNDIIKNIEVSYNSIGNIYLYLEQYYLAISNFEKALKIAQEHDHKNSISINYGNIGKVKKAEWKLKEAIEYVEKALEIDMEIGNHFGRMICYNDLAEINIELGNYNKALEYLKQAEPIAESVKNNYYITAIKTNYGLVYTRLYQYETAKEYLDQSIELAQKYHLNTLLSDIYLNCYEFYKSQDNYQEALSAYRKHIKYNRELTDERKAQYVNDLIIKYETQKKEDKINLLETESKLQSLQYQKNRTWGIAGFFFALLSAVAFLYLHQRNILKIQRLQNNAIRYQLNPHFIFNALNSIKSYIINNEARNAAKYLGQFSKLMRKILEANSMKESNLKEELETLGLYSSLENTRFNNEIQFGFYTDEGIDLEKVKIPPLILQPFVENAIWHGVAHKKSDRRIYISILETTENININIEDNGIGRKKAGEINQSKIQSKKSIGIQLIKQILDSFYKEDYKLFYTDMTSETGESIGTKVTLTIPNPNKI